jgi:hypothetical protein
MKELSRILYNSFPRHSANAREPRWRRLNVIRRMWLRSLRLCTSTRYALRTLNFHRNQSGLQKTAAITKTCLQLERGNCSSPDREHFAGRKEREGKKEKKGDSIRGMKRCSLIIRYIPSGRDCYITRPCTSHLHTLTVVFRNLVHRY